MIHISKFKIITKGVYGLLIFCILVILVFTLNNFGVDTATVSAGYKSTQRLATSTLAFTNTVTTYKNTMDAQLEDMNQKAANGQIDPVTGELLYCFPIDVAQLGGKSLTNPNTIDITCDLATYSPNDSTYKTTGDSSGGSHNGVDFKPAIYESTSADLTSVPILSPCDGTVQVVGNSYNEFYVYDEFYEFHILHSSALASGITTGTKVKSGQVVAYMGGQGSSGVNTYGHHVHLTTALHATGIIASGRHNFLEVGAWDMHGAALNQYVSVGSPYYYDKEKVSFPTSPCSWSYIDNLRECPSYTYRAGGSSFGDVLYTVTFSKDESGAITYNASSYDLTKTGWLKDLPKEYYPKTEAKG